MSQEPVSEEIIIPDQANYAYQPSAAIRRRKYSPGLIGWAEHIPGVRTPRAASWVLFAIAILALILTAFLLQSQFPAQPTLYSTDGGPTPSVTP